MAYPREFMDELLARSDIVSVVSRYVSLSRRGSGNLGLCPFHNEKTPSFHVSSDKQFFHCFGCGEGGNVISFIMKVENLPFPEAVRKLASIVGMTVPEDDSGSDRERRERERILAANKDAARWFREQMLAPQGQIAREYHVDADALSQANHLERDSIPESGALLLIPMRK